MKRLWLEMIVLVLFLSLIGGVFTYTISGRFQLSLGATIGYFIGGLIVLLINLPWPIQLKKRRRICLKKLGYVFCKWLLPG